MPKRTPKPEAAVTDIRDARTAKDEAGNVIKAPTLNGAKSKRAKQKELPGMESPKHPELDTLMELYAEQATALSTARFNIGETKVRLIELAQKLGVTVYRDDTASPPLVLTLAESDVKVKVTPAGTALDDEAEDD